MAKRAFFTAYENCNFGKNNFDFNILPTYFEECAEKDGRYHLQEKYERVEGENVVNPKREWKKGGETLINKATYRNS